MIIETLTFCMTDPKDHEGNPIIVYIIIIIVNVYIVIILLLTCTLLLLLMYGLVCKHKKQLIIYN